MEISLQRLSENGALAPEILFLTLQKSYSVGRKSRNDFKLKSKSVSGSHCTFHHKPEGIFVEYLKSKKGLQINGVEQKKGEVVPLNHQDIIQIGDEFKYQLNIKPSDFFGPQTTNFNEHSIKIERIEPEENPIDEFQVENIPRLENGIIKNEPDPDFEANEISDLDAAMQFSVDETDDKSLLLPLINPEASTENSEVPTTNETITIKQERNQSDLNQNSLEDKIKIENPDIPSYNTTLFAKEITEYENSNQSLENESLVVENGNLEIPIPNLDEGMQIEIEEHDIKPCLPNPESIPESPIAFKPLLRIRNDLCNSIPEENHSEIRIKEEKIDSEFQTEVLENLEVRIKEERIESQEVEFVEERRKRKRNSVRIKEEKIDENISRPIKRERNSISLENFPVKQEPEMNYSEIVSDEIEFHEEKFPPSNYNLANDSDCTDCSTDSYNEFETSQKELKKELDCPEFKSTDEIQSMSAEELEEFKKKLENCELYNKDKEREKENEREERRESPRISPVNEVRNEVNRDPRNYLGAKVLGDYEEEKGREDGKKREKVKLNYSEYKKRKMAELNRKSNRETFPGSRIEGTESRTERIESVSNQDQRNSRSHSFFPVPSTSADPGREFYRDRRIQGVERESFGRVDPRLAVSRSERIVQENGRERGRGREREKENLQRERGEMGLDSGRKSRINGKNEKDEREKERRKRNEERMKRKAIKEKEKLLSTVPFDSEDLKDEMLMTIFSWDPALFEKGDLRGGTPILELRKIRKTALSYLNPDAYFFTIFNILLFDVSVQIQEAFSFGKAKSMLEKCSMLPDIVQKVMIKGTNEYLVPFFLKISVPIFLDSVPPEAGDLLRISVLEENAKTSVIFGYIQKIVNEEPTESRFKLVTYLISIKQQTFEIHNCKIENVRPILNLTSSMKIARAIYYLKKSPLLPCILRPNPEIDCSEPFPLLSPDDLFYQKTFDRRQLAAVSKILQSFRSEEPNICVIEGTAGTGKTSVVVNTILQLLCSKQRKYKFDKDHLRILVCTSTNIEFEEIITRVNNAIDVLKIGKDVIKMVVVGPDDGRRERMRDLSLSNFAKNHVEVDIQKYQETIGLKSMEEQAKIIEEEMKRLSEKFEDTKCVHVALQMSLLNKYFVIGKSGRKVKKMTAFEKKEMIDVAELTYLAGANLIFSNVENLTCSVMEKFREKFVIPVCIIDESSQITEQDTLKILSFKGKTLVLLGDIYKYPVSHEISPKLRNLGWGNSLFNRIADNFQKCQRSPFVNLITQYRITPRLENWFLDLKMFGLNTLRNFVTEKIPFPLHSLTIFNLLHTEDFIDNEAVFASRIIHCIAHFGDLRRMERVITVGVIISDNDAKEHVQQEIENKLEEVLPGKRQILKIEVDTIDSFQNHEKDIVLASCIRNKHLCTKAGFMRFYYTLSRAKHCLIIYGRFSKVGKFEGFCSWHQFLDANKKKPIELSSYAESTELRRYLII